MVLWPDLRGDFWTQDVYAVDATSRRSPCRCRGSSPRSPIPPCSSQDAHLTYRMDAPADITRVVYGGRLHNFRPGSYIDFLHSFDGGATWIRLVPSERGQQALRRHPLRDGDRHSRRRQNGALQVPRSTTPAPTPGARAASTRLRMEVNHRPRAAGAGAGGRHAAVEGGPCRIARRWREATASASTEFPFKYVVNVGGSDHPVMESIDRERQGRSGCRRRSGTATASTPAGRRYVHTKRTDGANLAKNRPYTFSRAPSGFQGIAPGRATPRSSRTAWSARPRRGGMSYWWGQCWSAGTVVDLQVDLGGVRAGRRVPRAPVRLSVLGRPRRRRSRIASKC